MTSYLRLLRFAGPYRWRIAAALCCMVVLALANAAYANVLGPFLEFLFTGKPGSISTLSRFAPDASGIARVLQDVSREQILAALPVVVVGLALVKGFAQFGQYYLMSMTSQRVTADLRQALYDKLLSLSPGYYTKRHSGDIMNRMAADVQAVEIAVTNSITSYVRDGLGVLVMLGNCFYLDWQLSLIAFGAVPVTLLPVARLARRLRRSTTDTLGALGTIAESVQETVTGIRVVQSFGMERWESRRFAEANRRLLRFVRRTYLARGLSSPLMEVMAAVGLSAAIWWVGGRIFAGQLAPGKFFSFITAVLLLYQPVKSLGRVGQMAMQGAAAGDRLFEILDTTSPVVDSGRGVLAPFAEAIRYEGVQFAYGDRPVLRGLDLVIRKGEVVALVGSSGGGKTTVANLLPRFWDVGGGRITVDGVDVRDVTLASLRAQVALVTQETVLFNDTVRANVAYGRPEVTQAEVERAARLAQAHDFVVALPHGYETRIGEKGVTLSGGQRQRLAIARAFLKDAPILVLDEATSALDAESEREVQRALDGLMGLGAQGHRTTLVIAHRLSTIRGADRIVVLSHGRVVEEGRHEELLSRGGEYARLYRIYEGGGQGRAGAAAGAA